MSSKITFEKLTKYFHENTLAHAYLIETNNEEKCLIDLIDFLKQIHCPNTYVDNCDKCNICHMINKREFPNLIIIEPDGMFIKKEQILELKRKTSLKSSLSKMNIYIIKNAEKLNNSSSNTMLKFIEEPYDDCLGFFITNSKDNLLNTIQSRCEIIVINYDEEIFSNLGIDDSTKEKYLDIINKYLKELDQTNKNIKINKDIILSSNLEKKDIENILKIINYIYSLYLNKKEIPEIFGKYDFINENSLDKLFKKNKLISEILNKINYNLNMELLLDRLVIEMGEINE